MDHEELNTSLEQFGDGDAALLQKGGPRALEILQVVRIVHESGAVGVFIVHANVHDA